MKNHLKPSGRNYLFAKTSFLQGMSGLLELSGNRFPFRFSNNSVQADNMALFADWQLIGHSLYEHLQKREKQI
jgi:hypothetical protein